MNFINYFRYLDIKSSCVILIVLVLGFASCKTKDPDAKYFELVSKAESYIEQDKLEEARISLLTAIDLKPTEESTYFKLADVFLKQKEFGRAVQFYRSVLDINPNHREARLRLAAMMLAAREYERAEDDIRKLLESNPSDLEALILSANLKSVRKQYAEARTTLEQLLIDNPKSSIVYANLADVEIAEGNVQLGEDYLHKAYKLDPDNNPIRLSLADLYIMQGRYDDAEGMMQELVDSNPKDVAIRFYFGEFLLSRGAGTSAVDQYKEIVQSAPFEHNARDRLYDYYVTRGDNDLAFNLTRDLKDKLPEDDPAVIYFLGRDAELLGEREQALSQYLKAIQGLSSFAPIFRNAGLMELALGKEAEGIEHLNQAIVLSPFDVPARLALARYFFSRGEHSNASEHVRRVLARYPRQIGANVLFADIALIQGDIGTAERIYNLLVESFPNAPVGYIKLGILSEKKNDIDKALYWYRRCLEFDRDVMIPARRYLQLLINKDGVDAAINEVKALKQGSKHSVSEYTFLLASLLMDKPDSSESELRALYEEALRLNPSLLDAYMGLATLDAISRDYQSAAENYKSIVKEQPSNIPARMLTALAYEQSGDYSNAAKEYREILSIVPRFGPAANNLAWSLAEELNGDLNEALNLALIAKEELPQESAVADTLGWIYYKRGSTRAALTLIEEAVELEKHKNNDGRVNPEILYHLGVINSELGDTARAKETLERAIASGGERLPQFAKIKKLLDTLE
jgi:tetratricopeptide (TPR) repeat protein